MGCPSVLERMVPDNVFCAIAVSAMTYNANIRVSLFILLTTLRLHNSLIGQNNTLVYYNKNYAKQKSLPISGERFLIAFAYSLYERHPILAKQIFVTILNNNSAVSSIYLTTQHVVHRSIQIQCRTYILYTCTYI